MQGNRNDHNVIVYIADLLNQKRNSIPTFYSK